MEGVTTTGIIPTRMGTSQSSEEKIRFRKDHPHAYGDKPTGTFGVAPALGSSPRVWGQVSHLFISAKSFGIIPTRMGTSSGLKAVCSKS